MSRRSIRTQLKTFFAGVDGVKSAWTAMPKNIPGTLQPAVVVYVPDANEERASQPAKIGKKRITHKVKLVVMWTDPSLKPEDGALTFDDLLDAIDAELRQHPQLDGSDPNILEVAQGYIRTSVAEAPFAGKDGGAMYRMATKEFDLIEYVVG